MPSLDRDQVSESLAKIISETRGVDEDECVDTTTLFGDLGLESIDFLEISFRMEESFGFGFHTDSLGELLGLVSDEMSPESVDAMFTVLETDFYITVEDRNQVPGCDPIDPNELRGYVFDLLTFGFLVDWVMKRASQV